MVPSTPGMFSFSQTGPSTDLLQSSLWDAATGEGSQNFQEFPDNGSTHTEDHEVFPFTFTGQATPRGDQNEAAEDFTSKWTASAATVVAPLGGEPMRRGTSRSSTGSHRQRTIKASHKVRPRLSSTLSQASSQLSSMDITGNTSAFQDGSQANAQLMDVNPYSFPDSDASSVSSHMFFPGLSVDLGNIPDGMQFSQAELSLSHVVPAHMQLDPDTSLTANSPSTSWASFSPNGSRISSPGLSEDPWGPLPLTSSPSESLDSSPVLPGQSPRYALSDCCPTFEPVAHTTGLFRLNRKLGAQVAADDLNASVVTAIAVDDFALPPSYNSRRQSQDGETARDHPLYKNAVPKSDGLFHCPWEGQASCNHKPEKLKCNYE
jgi:hypothetical protein